MAKCLCHCGCQNEREQQIDCKCRPCFFNSFDEQSPCNHLNCKGCYP